MIIEWIWIGALFAAVFLLSFTLLHWANGQRERVHQQYEEEVSDEAAPDSSPDLVLGEMTPALAGQLPIVGEEKRKQLRSELQQAGFYRSTALMEFTAVRAVLVLLPLLFTGLLALLVDQQYVLLVLIMGLCISALGYSLPRIYVNMVARRRQIEIEKGLPVAVDLLALGLLSGQNVLLALRRVCHEIRFSFPVLAHELTLVRQQAELNTLPHALAQMADRVQIPELRNLVIILNQSQRQGMDIAPSLMEFSNNFRTNLRQQADKRANQASFWLVFPSIFFLWAPAFAVLVAPIAFDFRARRDETRRIMDENRERAEQMQRQMQRQPTTPPPAGPTD